MHSFDFDEYILKFRYPILVFFLGIILVGLGVFIFKSGIFGGQTKIEVLEGTTEGQGAGLITAEISGAVINPGVYQLASGARIDDLIISAGGFSGNADRIWTDKYVNRAAKVSDGQKIYVPAVNEQSSVLSAKSSEGYQTTSSDFLSDSKDPININTAGLGQLDALPGIGQVYGQSIIEHRPYSTVEELVSKGAIKQYIFEKIKDLVTVY